MRGRNNDFQRRVVERRVTGALVGDEDCCCVLGLQLGLRGGRGSRTLGHLHHNGYGGNRAQRLGLRVIAFPVVEKKA
jgi:hypothetical protein